MSRKSKGCNAERELVEKLEAIGYAAVRVAGSGVSKFPCPDVLASNGNEVLAIECKSTKGETQYIKKSQIEDLKVFSKMFGAKPLCAVRFNNVGWHFIEPDKMKASDKFHVTDREHIKREGINILQ